MPLVPATDETMARWPLNPGSALDLSLKYRNAASAILTYPRQLTFTVLSSIFGSSSRFCFPTPDTMKMRSAPPVLPIRSISREGESSAVTSKSEIRISAPGCSATNDSSISLRLPAMPTVQPSSAIRPATARPMPDVAPITIALILFRLQSFPPRPATPVSRHRSARGSGAQPR